jgi:hypothetical protein
MGSSMKLCKKCGIIKPFSQFSTDKKSRDKLKYSCKECNMMRLRLWRDNNPEKALAATLAWQAANPERIKKRQSAHRAANPELYAARIKTWREKNPERDSKNSSRWASENKAKKSAISSRYNASKYQALPKWADQKKIQEFYDEAKRMSTSLGEQYEVDHIVPLQGKTVCGLHCEANLQILHHKTNAGKGNRIWPDMP